MFSRLFSSRALASAASTASRVPVAPLFAPATRAYASSWRDFVPHSPAHLDAQREELTKRGIEHSTATLLKGARLKGLNVTVEPIIDAIVPLHEEKTLSHLTLQEKAEMADLKRQYFARMADYIVREDIECVTSKTEAGHTTFYVDDRKAAMRNLRPIEEYVDLSDVVEETNSKTPIKPS